MPVRKVRGGFRWGKSGKIYPTKKKALSQGVVIMISQGKIKLNKLKIGGKQNAKI